MKMLQPAERAEIYLCVFVYACGCVDVTRMNRSEEIKGKDASAKKVVKLCQQ